MKRMPREPLGLDRLFSAFTQFAAQQGLSIRDATTRTTFLEAAGRATDEALANDAFVHGARSERLFETVVAGLGRVKLLKQEDVGDAYYGGESELTLPDYRLVLEDDTQILVEVKNFYQSAADSPCVQRVSYLEQLEAYAALTKSELLVAVYWVRWNVWTLVPTTAFVREGDKVRLRMGDAILVNHMARLGDVWIAAPWPFRVRIEVEEIERHGETRKVVIKQVLLLCAERRLSAELDRRIALFFIFNGSWEEEEDTHIEKTPDGRLTAVEHRIAPREEHRHDGLNMIGALSGMISRFFRGETAKDGHVPGYTLILRQGSSGA